MPRKEGVYFGHRQVRYDCLNKNIQYVLSQLDPDRDSGLMHGIYYCIVVGR